MTKKIKFIVLFSFLILLGLCTKSQARITTSDPTVSSGGTATITINSQEAVASGAINVSSSGGLTFISASSNYNGVANDTMLAFSTTKNVSSGIATYKFKVPNVSKTTTYKVTFSSADMTKVNGDKVSSSSATATVTVKAKSSSSSSGSSSSGGSSSSSGSSSSGNSSSSSDDEKEDSKVSFREVNEKVYATDSGINVRSSYSTSSSSVGSLNKGDELTRTGVATKSVNGITWSRVEFNGQTAYVSSAYLTTEKPDESAEKALKSLEVEGYKLTPEFSSEVTEYTLNVTEDVTSLDIKAEPEDEKAKVKITGNDELLDGVNKIEIKVTAEDGTERKYTINVIKGEMSSLGLEELNISGGYTLNPTFSSDVYEYTLEINDLSVTSLDIEAVANVEDADIEIVGNTELKPGENIVTILVKSADGNDIRTYQIIVNIVEKQEEQIIAGIDNNDLFVYGGIALGVIVLIIIIAVIRHRRKMLLDEEDDDYEPYYGGFDSLNRDVNKNNNLSDTQDLSNVINNKNIPNVDETQKVDLSSLNDKKEENSDPIKEHRKSVIEENFGADIKNEEDNKDDKGGRRRGKHF